jgi:hypothetical protein
MFFSKRIFFLLVAVQCAAFVLVGCDDGSTDDVPRFGPKVTGAELSGTWKSSYDDKFTIDTTANTFSYSLGDTPDYGTESMDYKGNIVGEVLADKTLLQSKYGYLTIKITNAGGNGPTVGKYFVIHWKDLTTNTVQEAGAYKKDGQNKGMDTPAAAAAEYTVGNGYFEMFGTYTKQ